MGVERIRLSTQQWARHLDAAMARIIRTMNEGERSVTDRQIPREWCFQPAGKLDVRSFGMVMSRTARRRRGGAQAYLP